MQKNLFLFLGLFASLATASLAQNNLNQKPDAVSGGYGGGFMLAESRPRVADVKASAVKSSVITNTASFEQKAFDILNQKRLELGLRPLTWNDQLASVARVHSQNMAEFEFFDHRGLDGKMVSDRADSAGLESWTSIGENIAFNRGYSDPVG